MVPNLCTGNPTKLTADEKRELGISRRMPITIQQATDALDGDDDLQRTLNPGLVKHYVAMKRAEQEMLEGMSDRDRRVWLIERY
jgi:glutamine synthetase